MKHTPGEWIISAALSDGNQIAILSRGKDQSLLAEVTKGENGIGEANAKLIAAAPDLLDALQKAIQVIKQWHRADDVFNIYYEHAPEMKPIREAIKKATE